jgi:hypothetical protein
MWVGDWADGQLDAALVQVLSVGVSDRQENAGMPREAVGVARRAGGPRAPPSP